MSTTISGDTCVDKATNQAVKDAIGVTGTAPIFGCRAWVNFDGTRNEADTGASVIGQNVKIMASGNVSSVVKNGVGDYTVNFTTAMPDINYGVYFGATHVYNSKNLDFCIMGLKHNNGGVTPRSTTSIKVVSSTYGSSAVLIENIDCNVSIFR